MQYTIRSIPPQLDKVLRARAKKAGKSLNEIVIETLNEGSGLGESIGHDLDWFIGAKMIDNKSFDEAMEWLDSLPNDLVEKPHSA